MARRELAEETQRFIRNCPEQEINVAIMKGDVEWVEELLSKDVNINVQAVRGKKFEGFPNIRSLLISTRYI